MMGTITKGFRPAKQKRYDEQFKPNSVSNQIREAGSGESPLLSLLEAREQMEWSKKDDAKYLGSGTSAPTINNPAQTQTGGRSTEYTLNRKNNLEVARDKRNKKTGGGGKRTPSDKIRIKKTNQVNTNETNSGGVNF